MSQVLHKYDLGCLLSAQDALQYRPHFLLFLCHTRIDKSVGIYDPIKVGFT